MFVALCELLRPDNLVNQNYGAVRKLAMGHYTKGAEMIGQALDQLPSRRPGFQVYRRRLRLRHGHPRKVADSGE
jgi:murein endopeptidase